MSKEKSLHSVVTRGQYSYRTPRTASSAGSDGSAEKPMSLPPKRVCLGGRGREWAAESLKLLETMSNLEDAKLFLEPMNPLKYPEYYNMIRDPIDLSKIMLKFHGGSYPGLIHFSEDMNSMFDNYKSFFKDSSTDVYHQVRRLSSWFDAELDQIKSKWYRIYDNGTRLGSGNSNGVTPRTGSLDARIQAIKADNRRTVNLSAKSASRAVQLASLDSRAIRLPQSLNALPLSSAASVNGAPVLAFRLASDTKANSSASVKLPPAGNPQSIILVSKSGSDINKASSESGLVYMCADWSKQAKHKPGVASVTGIEGAEHAGGLLRHLPDVSQLSGSTMLSSAKARSHCGTAGATSLKLDVGNVWFGTARNPTNHPVTVNEDGFHFLLRNGDSDVPFTIGRDEIVKCAAYFGNIRKHTLFLFVLPNCVRRLAFLGDEFMLSSLIIMFPPALPQTEIATLVYLFWRMSRLSMFGELFCEIDQKSAVALLGNIKPTIISNIAEKYKDALSNSAEVHPTVTRLPVDPAPFVIANRGNGALSSAVATTDDGALLLSDTVEAFSEVDCKMEPPDDESPCQPTDTDLVNLGLASIVDSKCLTVSKKLASAENVQDGSLGVGTKSDVIRKRLKIRYRPGILKHSKKRKTEDVEERTESNERKSDSPLVEEESDNQFTIIEWFPEDENPTVDDERSSDSDSSVRDELPSVRLSKDENDLEIVAESNDSDAELDLDVNYDVVPSEDGGREDLVMTKEKINIRCPITQQIMEYPVKNIHCNHCYDRQGVEDLIKHRGDKAKCPVTGCSNSLSLQMKDVKYDSQLLFYIQQKLNQGPSK